MRQNQFLVLAAILGNLIAPTAAFAIEPDLGKNQPQAAAPDSGNSESGQFLFAAAGAKDAKDTAPLLSTPDGKVRLEIHGNKAQLVEAASGKIIGAELDAGTMWTTDYKFTFTCWSFSPDGKFVATGSEFVERTSKDVTDVGRVQISDATTGTLVKQTPQGGVLSVVFRKDGKTVVFRARPCQVDGP